MRGSLGVVGRKKPRVTGKETEHTPSTRLIYTQGALAFLTNSVLTQQAGTRLFRCQVVQTSKRVPA